MNTDAEVPILATGAVSLASGFVSEGHFPKNGWPTVIAVVGLLLVGAMLERTKVGRIYVILMWLTFLGVVYRAVPMFTKARKAVKTNG